MTLFYGSDAYVILSRKTAKDLKPLRMTLFYGSDANVILSRENGEGSQNTRIVVEILRSAQDDAFLRQRR